MATPLSFTLLYGAPVTGNGVLPSYPNSLGVVSGAALTCNSVEYDQQHFLDLFDRLLPYDYIAPMKLAANSGYELIQTFAAVGARLSQAIARLECGAFVIFATSGVATLVGARFARPDNSHGNVTIKAGTIVKTSRHNRRFVLVNDLAFTGATLVGNGIVAAEAAGYEYNVVGKVITAASVTIPGDIDTIETLKLSPPFGDPSFTVSQLADPTLGKSPDIDGLGDNRALARAPGEQDESYRLRIRTLPDVVSPAAIRRAVSRRLTPLKLPFDIIEVWEHRWVECWDAPSPNVGTPTYQAIMPTNPDYNNTTLSYDNTSLVPGGRYLDDVEFRGTFYVLVVANITIQDVGMAYDDPGMLHSDFNKPLNARGTPAYDNTSTDNPAFVYPAAYDGWDYSRAAAYAGMWAELQAIKPLGVAALVILDQTTH